MSDTEKGYPVIIRSMPKSRFSNHGDVKKFIHDILSSRKHDRSQSRDGATCQEIDSPSAQAEVKILGIYFPVPSQLFPTSTTPCWRKHTPVNDERILADQVAHMSFSDTKATDPGYRDAVVHFSRKIDAVKFGCLCEDREDGYLVDDIPVQIFNKVMAEIDTVTVFALKKQGYGTRIKTIVLYNSGVCFHDKGDQGWLIEGYEWQIILAKNVFRFIIGDSREIEKKMDLSSMYQCEVGNVTKESSNATRSVDVGCQCERNQSSSSVLTQTENWTESGIQLIGSIMQQPFDLRDGNQESAVHESMHNEDERWSPGKNDHVSFPEDSKKQNEDSNKVTESVGHEVGDSKWVSKHHQDSPAPPCHDYDDLSIKTDDDQLDPTCSSSTVFKQRLESAKYVDKYVSEENASRTVTSDEYSETNEIGVSWREHARKRQMASNDKEEYEKHTKIITGNFQHSEAIQESYIISHVDSQTIEINHPAEDKCYDQADVEVRIGSSPTVSTNEPEIDYATQMADMEKDIAEVLSEGYNVDDSKQDENYEGDFKLSHDLTPAWFREEHFQGQDRSEDFCDTLPINLNFWNFIQSRDSGFRKQIENLESTHNVQVVVRAGTSEVQVLGENDSVEKAMMKIREMYCGVEFNLEERPLGNLQGLPGIEQLNKSYPDVSFTRTEDQRIIAVGQCEQVQTCLTDLKLKPSELNRNRGTERPRENAELKQVSGTSVIGPDVKGHKETEPELSQSTKHDKRQNSLAENDALGGSVSQNRFCIQTALLDKQAYKFMTSFHHNELGKITKYCSVNDKVVEDIVKVSVEADDEAAAMSCVEKITELYKTIQKNVVTKTMSYGPANRMKLKEKLSEKDVSFVINEREDDKVILTYLNGDAQTVADIEELLL